MTFDNSRFTFNPTNDYFGVVMQQGRVQLDSDWNEWLAELRRRIQAGTLDTLGQAVYPSTTPYAFQITPSAGKLMIGPGRMYVDGLLVENHGDPGQAVWDPALAEMSNAPQPPPNPPPAPPGPGSIDYTIQPHPPTFPLPTSGVYLAYLDVWTRPVTYLEDSNLIDSAVGVDTTGRLETVWQVKLSQAPSTATCGSVTPGQPASSGLLSTTTTPNTPSGPCCINDSTGYTGMENQFYRVEIHQPGTPATVPASLPFTYPLPTGATFKFSRDNGSVQTGVAAITPHNNSAGAAASRLTVLSLGRDQTLGFRPGDWIEIVDDNVEFNGVPNGAPGVLYQIDSVDPSGPSIQLTTTVPPASFPSDPTTTHTRLIRWDQNGKIFQSDGTKLTNLWVDLGAAGSTGDIPVPPPGTMLVLENGVTVSFSQSAATPGFLCADFWTFAARTATGKVEELIAEPPRGIHHHYAALAIVNFTTGGANDCRNEWPPASSAECGCCCSVTVGGTQYPTIQSAIQAVAAMPHGGEVCIPAGIYYENVFIEGLSDVVIKGCGAQTRVASLALTPTPAVSIATTGTSATGAAPGTSAGSGTSPTTPPYAAVFTVSGTQNITFTDFVIEAADSECGILLDGSGTLGMTPPAGIPLPTGSPIAIDTTIEKMYFTASTMPAIFGFEALLLKIEQNRIAMENVPSLWPAVWVNGREIHIDGNWVGIQSESTDAEWLPAVVGTDLQTEQNASGGAAAMARHIASARAAASDARFEVIITTTGVPLHPGGIQIGARARDVYVTDNEIDNGSFNGITLGSLTTTTSDGTETGQPTGTVVNQPGPCFTTSTLVVDGGRSGSSTGQTMVAGGPLIEIQIQRNRIRSMGLCGIGPAGFFDLSNDTEVITVTNLDISGNTIENTLRSPISSSSRSTSNTPADIGYGAICLPDVQNVVIRDNTITDFGQNPGDEVCGIYILHGEVVEISRNQVNEARSWSESSNVSENRTTPRGGVWVAMVTPPVFTTAGSLSAYLKRDVASTPYYQPGMPALRVENNVVRVPLCVTLYAVGYGPFSIIGNHLSCGGTVTSGLLEIADTVRIMNLGVAIEIAGLFSKYAQLGNAAGMFKTPNFRSSEQTPASGGTVLFTNNVCQLEKIGEQFALASVMILSLDQIVFSNNQCWADGALATIVDALLLAGTVQVTSNRFQESLLPLPPGALYSGITFGLMSVTADNISTLCLLAIAPPTARVYANNISLVALGNSQACGQWGEPSKQ
jgi:hypothetical protein